MNNIASIQQPVSQVNTEPKLKLVSKNNISYKGYDSYDSFELSSKDMLEYQKKLEKERKKEKLKSNLTWGVGIASGLAIITMLAIQLKGMRGAGNAVESLTNVNLNWVDMQGQKIVADLNSKTTSKTLRETFKKILSQEKLSQKAKEWGGMSDNVNMIYLYGHGGVGKTYVAKQYAQAKGAIFTSIKFPDIGSPFKDASSMKIATLFDNIINKANANKNRDVVVCMDEFDAVIKKINENLHGSEEASKARAAILTGIDKVREQCKNVTFIATSNYHPESGLVDAIALRRFNNKVLVPLPDQEQCKTLLEMYLKKQNMGALSNQEFFNTPEFKAFADKLCSGKYSNGEIALIAEEAGKSFRASLVDVAEKDLTNHKFTINFLEDGMKINGKAAAQTNNLMNV